jgi:hypothetical protein
MKNDPRNRRPTNAKGYAKGWSLRKSEVKALLAEETWTLDPENTVPFSWDAYVSDRGELLLAFVSGKGVLYASRKELMEISAERHKGPRSFHMLEGRLPQGPHFIEAVPSLLDELAGLLKMPRESLDTSFESLHLVDAALKKIRPRKRILEIPNLYPGLIAYAGEVMRKETAGYWKLTEIHGGIFEPYIFFGPPGSFQYLNPWLETYKAIAELGRLSLAAIVAGELMGAGVDRGND